MRWISRGVMRAAATCFVAACSLAAVARAQAPDVVYLRDGTRLRGTFTDYRPTVGGTVVVDGTPITLAPEQIDHVARLDTDSPHAQVAVHLTSQDGSPLTFYRVVGETERRPPANDDGFWNVVRDVRNMIGRRTRSYDGPFLIVDRLCTTPCQRMLPVGAADFAVGVGRNEPRLAGTAVVVEGATLQATLVPSPAVAVVTAPDQTPQPYEHGNSDGVELVDGTRLSGVLERWTPGSEAVLIDTAGQRVALPAPSIARVSLADLATDAEPDPELVDVEVASDAHPFVYRESGAYIPTSGWASSAQHATNELEPDYSIWSPICRAPCTTSLARGRYLFGLANAATGLRVAAPSLLDIDRPGRLRVALDDHEDTRRAGIAVAGIGVLVALGLMITGFALSGTDTNLTLGFGLGAVGVALPAAFIALGLLLSGDGVSVRFE